MKRVVNLLRESLKWGAVAVFFASMAHASPLFTVSYYVDIFGGSAMSGPITTPLTNSQLIADAAAATQKNLPYSANVTLPAFSTVVPPGTYSVLQSVSFQLATDLLASVDATNTSTTQGYAFTNLIGIVPITISGTGLGAGVSQTMIVGPLNGNVPEASIVSTPVFSDTPLTSTVIHHSVPFTTYAYGDGSESARTALETASAANGFAPVPVCDATDAISIEIFNDGFDLAPTTSGTISGSNCHHQTSSINTVSDGVIDYNGLTASLLGPTTTVTTGLSAFNAPLSYNFGSSITVGAACCTPTPPQNVVNFGGSGFAQGELQVTYSYTLTNVPEPGSMFLIGSSMLAVGFLLRRKKRRL